MNEKAIETQCKGMPAAPECTPSKYGIPGHGVGRDNDESQFCCLTI